PLNVRVSFAMECLRFNLYKLKYIPIFIDKTISGSLFTEKSLGVGNTLPARCLVASVNEKKIAQV
ncbi:MAG: hypothetical protein AB2707_04465, partial [Candidatus Thiodiazotropha sp.]